MPSRPVYVAGLARPTVIGCGGFCCAILVRRLHPALTMGRSRLGQMDRFQYEQKGYLLAWLLQVPLGYSFTVTGFVIYAILTEQKVRTIFLAGVSARH